MVHGRGVCFQRIQPLSSTCTFYIIALWPDALERGPHTIPRSLRKKMTHSRLDTGTTCALSLHFKRLS